MNTPVFVVGNVVEFEYRGKVRRVRIEKTIQGNRYGGLITCTYSITGWDYYADAPVGGYRTFLVQNIGEVVVVATR